MAEYDGPEYADWTQNEPGYGEWNDWEEEWVPREQFWDALGQDDILQNYMSDLMEPGISDEQRQEIFDSLAEYLDWEYDIDLNDVWDWEDFRAYYENH